MFHNRRRSSENSTWESILRLHPNLTAKTSHLLIFITLSIASSAHTHVIRTCNAEQSRLAVNSRNRTQSERYEDKNSIEAIQYKPLEHQDGQVDRPSAVKRPEDNLNTDGKEQRTIPDEYLAYRDNFCSCSKSLRVCGIDVLIPSKRRRTKTNVKNVYKAYRFSHISRTAKGKRIQKPRDSTNICHGR